MIAVADENSFHPVRDWILSKPWNGEDHIQKLMDTIESPSPKIRDVLIYRWLISAVAALFVCKERDGFFWSKGILVFQGEQNIGKTSWFRSLYPPNSGFGIEGKYLDPKNKDSVEQFLSHWLIELGELKSTLKSNQEILKAFVTNSVDEIRKPYAREKTIFQRRSVMFGSVNEGRFLSDTTGNFRFWCVPVTKINFRHEIDMQQLWAQVAVEYANGEQWHLTDEESAMLAEHNQQFEMVDPIEELIYRHFDMESTVRMNRLSATTVLKTIGYPIINKSSATQCGNILKKLFDRKRSNGQTYYMLPPGIP